MPRWDILEYSSENGVRVASIIESSAGFEEHCFEEAVAQDKK
jgi:hypothetical protein